MWYFKKNPYLCVLFAGIDYEEKHKVILINYHIIELLLPTQIKYLFMLLSIMGIIVGWFVLGFIYSIMNTVLIKQ